MNRLVKTSAIVLTFMAFSWTASQASDINSLMAAPKVEIDADGLFNLNEAPATVPHVSVKNSVSEDGICTIKILVDGVDIQTITFENMTFEHNCKTSFLDVNFDGYLDLLYGAFVNRDFSYVFLWDPSQRKFVKTYTSTSENVADSYKSVFNGDYCICPGKKVLYCYGSNGVMNSTLSRMQWHGVNLVDVETLNIDTSFDDGGSNLYTLHKGSIEGEVILQTYDKEELPEDLQQFIQE